MIIAVDFDGTCVEHEYPDIGPDVPGAVDVLLDLVAAGHELIIWTMRDGEELEDAEVWWKEREILYIGANRNPDQYWTSSPKVYSHLYIDDAALGCPLIANGKSRPYVNWVAVRHLLILRGIL